MLEKHLYHSSGLWLAIVQGVVFHLWSDSVTAVPSTIPPPHALTYSHSTTHTHNTHRPTHAHTHNHLNTVLHKHEQISSNGCSSKTATWTRTHSIRKQIILEMTQYAKLHICTSGPAKLPREIRSDPGLLGSNEWHPHAPICWIIRFPWVVMKRGGGARWLVGGGGFHFLRPVSFSRSRKKDAIENMFKTKDCQSVFLLLIISIYLLEDRFLFFSLERQFKDVFFSTTIVHYPQMKAWDPDADQTPRSLEVSLHVATSSGQILS